MPGITQNFGGNTTSPMDLTTELNDRSMPLTSTYKIAFDTYFTTKFATAGDPRPSQEQNDSTTTVVAIVVCVVVVLVLAVGVILYVKKHKRETSNRTNHNGKGKRRNNIPVISIVDNNNHPAYEDAKSYHKYGYSLRPPGNLQAQRPHHFNDSHAFNSNSHLIENGSNLTKGTEQENGAELEKNVRNLSTYLPSLSNVIPSITASQQVISISSLIDHGFVRGAPSRRSNSLCSLSQNRPLNKSSTMASQDSGFSSALSMPCSPVSPTSVKGFIGSNMIAEQSSCSTKQRIQRAIEHFYRIPNRNVGECYASQLFAIGEFDSRGGILRLANSESVALVIPPGALENLQLVYLLMQFENNCVGDESANISPSFECGPDGLRFNKPVELTFPHAAVDMEVTAVSRQNLSTRWEEDGTTNGPDIINISPETATLKIHHFTGFKLSPVLESSSHLTRGSRSRIPIRVPPQRPSRRGEPSSPPAKKLLVAVFMCGDKVRVYFITNSAASFLSDVIDQEEERLGFTRDSRWKPFLFYCHKGGLVIDASVDSNGSQISYKQFTFNDSKVLNSNQEYVEVISKESLLLDITFNQPGQPDNYTQFCVSLEKHSSQISLPEELRRRIYIQHIDSLMCELTLQKSELVKEQRPAPRPKPRNLTRGNHNQRSGGSSQSAHSFSSSSTRYPEENCEHNGQGACSCWKQLYRSPTESECDGNAESELKRGVTNRRSKESGYGSVINSPVSPLKGPESLPSNDSMALRSRTSSEFELTLETVGGSSIPPPTYVQHTEL